MNQEIANAVVSDIELFQTPIDALFKTLSRVRDDVERKRLLEQMTEIMRILDGEIGFEARRVLEER